MRVKKGSLIKKVWCMLLTFAMLAGLLSGTGMEALAFSPIMIENADFFANVPVGGRQAWMADVWTNDDGYRLYVELDNNNSSYEMFNGGVAWYDETDQRYLYSGEEWVSGHIYTVCIATITTNNYYLFVNDTSSNKTQVDVTVNGQAAWIEQVNGKTAGRAFIAKYTFPACVEAPPDIEAIDINIQTPTAYSSPDFDISLDGDKYTFDGLDVKHYINGIAWYNLSNDTYLTQEDEFYPGNRYRVIVPLKRVEPYRFAVDEYGISKVRATIAGQEAEIYTHFAAASDDMSKYIAVAYTFEQCPEPIAEMALQGITPPVENATPDYTAVSAEPEKYDVLRAVYEPITWYKDGSVMNPNDTFEAGYRYAVAIQVYTKENLVFKLDENLDPAVTATLNDKTASVTKAWEQDPFEVLEVYYDFGICNDTVIEIADIKGVTEPVVGQCPEYTAYVDGTGYYIPDNKGEIVKNGICWYDVTEDDYMYPDDPDSVFVAGHEYKICIDLETEDGYEFYTPNDEIQVSGWLNDRNATMDYGRYGMPSKNLKMECSFTCPKETVYGVRITDLDVPRHGDSPDYELTLDVPEYIALDENYAYGGIYWYGPDNAPMGENDTFVAGESYQLEIKLIPVQLKGSDVCEFGTPFVASLNGNEIDSNDVWASSKAVYLYYDFTCTVPGQVLEVASLFDSIGIIDGSNYIKKADSVAQAEDAFETLSAEYQEFFVNAAPATNFGISYQTFITAKSFYENLGMWSTEVKDQTYTGKKITPKADVYYHARKLTPNDDYIISYKNNIKVNDASVEKTAPSIIVTGKGNYSGKEVINFKIVPMDMAYIDVDDLMVKANGKIQKPVPKIIWNGKTLKNKTDFIVNYPDSNVDAYVVPGEYTIEIQGINNFKGSKNIKLTVTSYDLTSKVTVNKIPKQKYNGGLAVTPTVTVKFGKKTLTENIDYTLAYHNNQYVGTALVVIEGMGDYVGKKTVSFNIVGTPIKKAKISGLLGSIEYFGEAYTPDCSLVITENGQDKVLTKNKDYSVSYQNNIKAGTATITFTGMNGYTGSVKKTFKILPYDISEDSNSKMSVSLESTAVHMKGGSKPKPVVYFGKDLLTEGVDYTLSYKNNGAVNDKSNPKKIPTVVIKGKGSFKGTIKNNTFSIVSQDISVLDMTAADKPYSTKKNGWKSPVTITDLNGKKLVAGTDYDKSSLTYTYASDTMVGGVLKLEGEVIAPSDILPQGTVVRVSVAGKRNYTGTAACEYRIVKKNISSLKFKIPDQIYTGKAICPDKSQITLPSGMNDSDYEIVKYSNNTQKGTATVYLKGVGNYGGIKAVTFKIKARKFLWWWR